MGGCRNLNKSCLTHGRLSRTGAAQILRCNRIFYGAGIDTPALVEIIMGLFSEGLNHALD
jgi:hypothetical protein